METDMSQILVQVLGETGILSTSQAGGHKTE